ncbi:uncharacterized protein [Procambarus clarkii]|uniref:uncharacterized protein n=1 Tax=Procambarus clarkii TaxID=6728 RepID=UPI003742243A
MNFLSTLEPNVFDFVQKSIYEGLAAFDEQGSVLHMDSYDVSTCGASTTTCGSTITVLPETDSHGEKGTPEPVLDDVEDADQLSHEYMLRRSQTCRYTSSEMTEDEIKEFIIKTFHPFENWTPGMEHEDVEAAGLSSGEVEFHLSCSHVNGVLRPTGTTIQNLALSERHKDQWPIETRIRLEAHYSGTSINEFNPFRHQAHHVENSSCETTTKLSSKVSETQRECSLIERKLVSRDSKCL